MNLDGNSTHLREANHWVIRSDVDALHARPFPAGTVVFPKVGAAIATNKKRLLTRPSLVDNNVMGVFPDSPVCLPEFLLHWFQGFDLISISALGPLPSITASAVKATPISLPSMADQQRVVRILSTIQATVGASEEEVQRIQRLRAVVLAEQLTATDAWQQLPLAEVADTASGGTPRSDVPEYYGGQIPWVQSGEVRVREIVATEKHLTPRGLAQSTARLFPPGTLLVAMYGATAGQVALLGVEAATNQAVCCVTPHPNIEARFLYYALEGARDRLRAERFGAAQPNLSQQLIRGFVLGIPSLDEQRRIVRVLSAIDRTSEAASRRLLSLRKVFSSALTQLLGGSE
jgi:type I restriction enzyme S subunit